MQELENSKESRELRMVITQKCNYKCVFCHKEGLQQIQEDKLSPQDIAYVFKIGKDDFGFNTVTITGGEPLVRKDLNEILSSIKKLGGEIVLTTNGFFLEDNLEVGKYLKRINVSIHSFDPAKYDSIVGVKNGYEKVIRGLAYLRIKYPDLQIRLNATLIKGINTSKQKILEYIDLAEKLKASIKFVELFPKTSKGFFPLEEAEKTLLELGFSKINSKDRKSDFKKGDTIIRLSKIFCAFAEDLKNPCKSCKKYNDLFITPSGEIKPCRSQLRLISILKDIKNRNNKQVQTKIKYALDILGDKCPYSKNASTKPRTKS